MQIEVGKKYRNGWGAEITIVSAPSNVCRWYEDHIGCRYHEDGAAVQVNGNPKFNLVAGVSTTKDTKP